MVFLPSGFVARQRTKILINPHFPNKLTVNEKYDTFFIK